MDKSIEVQRLLDLVSSEMRALVDALDQKTRDDSCRNILGDLHARFQPRAVAGVSMSQFEDFPRRNEHYYDYDVQVERHERNKGRCRCNLEAQGIGGICPGPENCPLVDWDEEEDKCI